MKKIKLVSLVSVNYKLILQPKKQFKSDGEISEGKRIYFTNGYAEVDEETFEEIQKIPQYGVDFTVATEQSVAPTPVTANVKGMDIPKEVNSEIETMKRQMTELTNSMTTIAQVVQNLVTKPVDKIGVKKGPGVKKESKEVNPEIK